VSVLATKVRTALALGLPNILRVVAYRASVRAGWSQAVRHQAATPVGPFFLTPAGLPPVDAPAVTAWQDSALLFGATRIAIVNKPPDWLAHPLTGHSVPNPQRGWWEIPDFDPAVGDIKWIWEPSRMDWAMAFAQQARQGDMGATERLNAWLADWCQRNPPYRGPNWKCGQEASIRVMHLAMAALMVDQTARPATGLLALVKLHLERIAPTVSYARAQDNNHGTSEAAALFIGGSWMAACGDASGEALAQAGRQLLEERTQRLISPDGTFSQYSLNYHRLLLDTLCMAEVWRLQLGLLAFSPAWQRRALAAAYWLYQLVDVSTGDGPNTGTNDGAQLLPLADLPFRDHRPSVQLAMALFGGQRAYDAGPWDHALTWLGVMLPTGRAPAPAHFQADEGGFAVLRQGPAWVLLRYPRFRFRATQADALHLDLWIAGHNLLRDAGTYSYNTEDKVLRYFSGTESHNTVQFDERDQMPRLGRFLFGDWLRTNVMHPIAQNPQGAQFTAGYRDAQGASHCREVRLAPDELQVRDQVAGVRSKAVLHWRLAPGPWSLSVSGDVARVVGHAAGQQPIELEVRSTAPMVRCELADGWESRHYGEKSPLQVLEVETGRDCEFTTTVRWHA
jgi:hypothetical protein